MPQEEVEFKHGATIIRQGDAGGGFYILNGGAVEVYRDDVLLTVLMFPGTIFGEMADILGKPRTCTVKAKNFAKLTFVHPNEIEKCIREQPEVALKIIKTLAQRLERTTQKYSEQTKESPMWSVQSGQKPPA